MQKNGFTGAKILVVSAVAFAVLAGGAYYLLPQQLPPTVTENITDTTGGTDVPTKKDDAVTCIDLTNNLIIGSTDAASDGEVSKLQKFLLDVGMYSGAINGSYDNATAEAVMKWQKAHGMDFVTVKSGVGAMTREKMSCGGSAVEKTVQKINWSIALTNPNITDNDDYRKYEQAIGVDVTFTDATTKTYSLGKAYGCIGSSSESIKDGKKILGTIDCYYALTGVKFLAYMQNGKFSIERQDESAKDGSVKTTVLLEI